ncbi:uncharacterized protein M6G45_004356 isoform 2-T2 [Spheniscus humboldti]
MAFLCRPAYEALYRKERGRLGFAVEFCPLVVCSGQNFPGQIFYALSHRCVLAVLKLKQPVQLEARVNPLEGQIGQQQASVERLSTEFILQPFSNRIRRNDWVKELGLHC